MKTYKSINSPKSLSQLKSERRHLQAQLDELLGTVRTTRLQSAHSFSRKTQDIDQIREKLRDIDLVLSNKKMFGTGKARVEHSPTDKGGDNAFTFPETNISDDNSTEKIPFSEAEASGGVETTTTSTTTVSDSIPTNTNTSYSFNFPNKSNIFDKNDMYANKNPAGSGTIPKSKQTSPLFDTMNRYNEFELGSHDNDDERKFGNFPFADPKPSSFAFEEKPFSGSRQNKAKHQSKRPEHDSNRFSKQPPIQSTRIQPSNVRTESSNFHDQRSQNSQEALIRNILNQLNIAQQAQDTELHDEPQLLSNQKPRDAFLRRLRAIPIFDGESYKALRDFLDITKALNDSWTNEAESNELIETINLQLRGEARDAVGNLFDSSYDEMKDKLLKHFAYLVNKDIVTSQLENLRQEPKETVSEYAERARKLLREKCNTYRYLSDEHKKEYDRTARRAFAKGMKDLKIRDRLLTRGSSSMEDAISYAIEAEYDAINSVANSELFCGYCKNSGHRERDCRRKENNSNGVSQLVNLLGNFNVRNNQNSNSRSNRWSNSRGGYNNNNQRNSNNNSRNWNNNRDGNWNNNRDSSSNYNRDANSNSNNNSQRNNSWRNSNNGQGQRNNTGNSNQSQNNRQNNNNRNTQNTIRTFPNLQNAPLESLQNPSTSEN